MMTTSGRFTVGDCSLLRWAQGWIMCFKHTEREGLRGLVGCNGGYSLDRQKGTVNFSPNWYAGDVLLRIDEKPHQGSTAERSSQ
ncbi:hypothetical protein PMIN02_012480, partial [Paraphaeosphaeria minitans]